MSSEELDIEDFEKVNKQFLESVNADLANHSSYRAVDVIGVGAQALVVRLMEGSHTYAAKVMALNRGQSDMEIGRNNEAISDVNFALRLKHVNIVGSIELIVGDINLYLVMNEARGSLSKYLDNKLVISSTLKVKIIFELGCGIDFIHSLGFVHCDIKPDNVLMMSDTLATISDFGLVRYKENSERGGCQTLHFRAPETFVDEGLLKYNQSTVKQFDYRKWSVDFTAGEIWSYGIMCLTIIYEKSSLTWDSIIYRKVPKKYHEENPYFTLLRYILEEHPRSVYEIITEVYGKPIYPQLEELLHMVCDMLLEIVAPRRISLFVSFLNSPFFSEKGLIKTALHNDDSYINMTIPLIGQENEIYSEDVYFHLDTHTMWMAEISSNYRFSPLVLMNSIDFFLQKAHRYITSSYNIRIFAIATMWLISNIVAIDRASVEWYIKSFPGDPMDNNFVYDMILHILRSENGLLRYNSLYSYLPSVGLLKKALHFMLDSKKYEDYGGPRGIADFLLNNETIEEIRVRRAKSEQAFDYADVMDKRFEEISKSRT